MADENTLGGETNNNSASDIATEQRSPTEEDVKKAEEFKETANGFFKSNKVFSEKYLMIK